VVLVVGSSAALDLVCGCSFGSGRDYWPSISYEWKLIMQIKIQHWKVPVQDGVYLDFMPLPDYYINDESVPYDLEMAFRKGLDNLSESEISALKRKGFLIEEFE